MTIGQGAATVAIGKLHAAWEPGSWALSSIRLVPRRGSATLAARSPAPIQLGPLFDGVHLTASRCARAAQR